jgi:hypothetical protein
MLITLTKLDGHPDSYREYRGLETRDNRTVFYGFRTPRPSGLDESKKL